MALGLRDLREQARYLTFGGAVRTVDRILANIIYWHDDIGQGCCTRQTFVKKVHALADGPQPPVSPRRQRYQTNGLLIEVSAELASLQGSLAIVSRLTAPLAQSLSSSDKLQLAHSLRSSMQSITRLRKKLEAALGKVAR